MELSFTDPEFTMTGVSLPGIPFLVDRDMKLVNIPNRFLYEIAVIHGRTRSPKTWKTYGNHLYEFFSFLEENNLEWNQVDQAQIAIWRNTCWIGNYRDQRLTPEFGWFRISIDGHSVGT